MVLTQAILGQPYNLLDADTTAAGAAVFYASAPSAVSIILQASLDGTNWYTLDTSTAAGGEMRTTAVTATTKIRINKNVQTGGGALTVTVVVAS